MFYDIDYYDIASYADDNTLYASNSNLDALINKPEHHITSLCKKASQKLHALARIAHYMDFEKRRSLIKAFVISQFNYCPLI